MQRISRTKASRNRQKKDRLGWLIWMNMKKREVSKWFYTILYLLYLADAAIIVLFFHFPLGMTQVPLLMGLVTVWIHRYGKDSNRVIQVTIPLLLLYITIYSQAYAPLV